MASYTGGGLLDYLSKVSALRLTFYLDEQSTGSRIDENFVVPSLTVRHAQSSTRLRLCQTVALPPRREYYVACGDPPT
jgi:hypothetical protein